MRVVGYARVSTSGQIKKDTIDIQKQELLKYAKDNVYELEMIFQDNGISGATDLEDRQGLVDLFDYIETNKIQQVLIFKLDRLAREIGLQEFLIRKLNKCDVQLISLNDENIDGDPQRKLFRVMLGAIADYERSLIDMRMTAGRLNKARKGGYSGGRIAMGYKKNGKELAVDNENAETIKKIFYLKRYKRLSMNKIACVLNEENIPTARNGKWYTSTIRAILKNKTYTKGLLTYKNIETQKSDLRLI